VARKAVSISIRGTRQYVQAVKVVATKNGKQVADIVRDALDKSMGAQIEHELALFFDSGVAQKPRDTERAKGTA
jgi:hypothetical protein